jgi:hypothetical protein
MENGSNNDHKPRIVIEKYLSNCDGKNLYGYKLFCFHGKVKLIYIDTWKNGSFSMNVYDNNFNLLENVNMGFPNDNSVKIKKPD